MQTEALKTALKGLTDREWPKPAVADLIEAELKQHKASKPLTPSKRGKGKAKADHSELKEAFEGLTLRKLEKITPERVYSMAVHPTPLKDLVFTGDKAGYLGVWDALAETPDEDPDEDGDGISDTPKTSWSVRAHTKGTISALRFSPTNGHTVRFFSSVSVVAEHRVQIFSSSYDTTLRQIDFETGQSVMVVNADDIAAEEEGEGETLLSGFDITRNGQELWVSDNAGGLLHRDLREPLNKTRRWHLDDKKIGCVSLNPIDEYHLATAHLTRDMRIWDSRIIRTAKTSATSGSMNEDACLAYYGHNKACSSAYFDPTGRHILSTSYDDCVRSASPLPLCA